MQLNPWLVIIVSNLLLWFPALKCLLIVDDVRWYGMIKNGSFLWKAFGWKRLLPFITARLYGGGTFGVKWNQKITRWSITSVQIDHAFSMFLTCVIGVLMYADFHSLWAVLLWTSASSTTHIAVWLNGRRYAVNIILTLLMVACINAGGYWRLCALVLYAATPIFHMTAFFAPVLYPVSIPLMVLIIVLFRDKLWSQIKQKESSIVESARKEFSPRRAIPIIKSYGFYFFKMLFPMMTRTNYNFLYRWGVDPKGNEDAYAYNVDFAKGCVALVCTAFGVAYAPIVYKGYIVFMFLATLQWCNIGNLTQIVADRYIVLANVFFQVILALWLPWWACLIVVGMNVCFTSMSYRMYENIEGMFDYHYYHWPQYTIVNREYIALCIKQGNYIKAYTMVKNCLRFNPTDWDLLFAAALCAKTANDRPQARRYVELMENNLYFGQEEQQKKWMAGFRQSL